MAREAYVTFVMRNDAFIPGALVFAYALKRQKTTRDLLCMITEDVSKQGMDTLRQVFDDVFRIDEWFVKHEARHERQDRPFLFTRFQALRLGPDGDLGKGYDKIIVADADVLPLEDYDGLFSLLAPAGIINEKKHYCMEYDDAGNYVIPPTVHTHKTWKWHEVYRDIPFGERIPKAITDRVINDHDNMGMNAALYLFEPSMTLYQSIVKDTKNMSVASMIAKWPWPEMQYITWKLSGEWHNMDLRYASFNGYPNIDVLKGIHFAGLKPWRHRHRSVPHFAKKEDYRLWYAVFQAMLNDYPILRKDSKLLKLNAFIDDVVKAKDLEFRRKHLPNIKHLFEH